MSIYIIELAVEANNVLDAIREADKFVSGRDYNVYGPIDAACGEEFDRPTKQEGQTVPNTWTWQPKDE